MKKFLVVLLILAVAGGLFAQGLVLSGGLKTGLKVQSTGDNDKYTTDTTVQMEHSADDENRLDFGGTYTAENFGVKFNMRFTDGFDSSKGDANPKANGKLVLTNAYVWADFLNDMINVKAGKIDDGVWKTMGDKDWNLSTGTGMRVEVKPLEGLNVGLAFDVGVEGMLLEDITNKDENDPKIKPGSSRDLTRNAVDPFKGNLFMGASYDIPDLVAVSAAVAFFGKGDDDLGVKWRGRYYDDPLLDENGDGNPTNDEGTNVIQNDFTAIFGVNLKMIEKLTAVVEGRLTFAEDTGIKDAKDALGAAWFTEKVEFAVNPQLAIGLIAHQKFAGADASKLLVVDKDGKAAEGFATLMFKLYGKFAINDLLTAALDIQFDTATWEKKDTKYDEDTKLAFKPKLTVNVGDGASIDIFDKITIPMWGTEVVKANRDRAAPITNQFQIDFTYKF